MTSRLNDVVADHLTSSIRLVYRQQRQRRSLLCIWSVVKLCLEFYCIAAITINTFITSVNATNPVQISNVPLTTKYERKGKIQYRHYTTTKAFFPHYFVRGGSTVDYKELHRTITTNASIPITASPSPNFVSTEVSSSAARTSKFQKECDDRAKYVKQLLMDRYRHVQTGKRMKDICNFMKHHVRSHTDRYESIYSSTIGSAAATGTDRHNDTSSISCIRTRKNRQSSNPFPLDFTSLNFEDFELLTQQQQNQQPVNCFVDSTGEMSLDIQPPTIWQLGIRFVQLCVNFAPIWSTVGLALCSQQFRQQYWYKWMTNSIGMSGAAWIKWGQWSATRNDMFPDALCDQLSTLHASAPAHRWSYSALTIEQSLGLGAGTLHCVFDHCDTEPIASGSIAQVHKAILCGQPVAIKVRHPNVRQLMELDFRLMTIAATIMDKVPALSWLHIRESVVQFSHTISAQAQLQIEAHHLEILNYNFRNWPRVSFPKPIFASSSMIIETYESGKITTDVIDKYNSMAEIINRGILGNVTQNGDVTVIESETSPDDNYFVPDTNDKAENDISVESTSLIAGSDLIPMKLAKFLVTTGVSLYLKMLLIDNLMHADLHPGNIMVDIKHHPNEWKRLEEKHQKQLIFLNNESDELYTVYDEILSAMDDAAIEAIRITLVDAGMVVRLTDDESSAFIGLLSSLGEGNGDEAAAYTLHFSLEQDSMTNTQKRDFAADMEALFQERCRGYGTNVDVGFVLRGILSLIRKHRVRIDANFATLVINCLCIESLARRVCPTYNVLDAGRPLLQGYRRFVKNKNGERPAPSPWFGLKMSLNALKKAYDDRTFFKKEALQKNVVQRVVVEKLCSYNSAS